jgi:glycogen debranching enzyme
MDQKQQLKNTDYFWNLGLQTLLELETDEGILASSREEVYGCIFGRDTLITCLKLLRVYKKTKDPALLPLVRKALLTLASLQGSEINIESGEEPGKCIHEYRPTGHERLTRNMQPAWYLYEDSKMRNYDTVDATPLMLIAFYRYWQYSKDEDFIKLTTPNVQSALNWCFNYGDSNGDSLIDYQFHRERKHGGLVNQNWMDSVESVFHETEGLLVYPMAPVEVQAYTYLAYRLWSKFFARADFEKSKSLLLKAAELKRIFNRYYITTDPDHQIFLAAKIDGEGKPFRSVRSNMGHVLWSSLNSEDDGEIDSVLDSLYIPAVVDRLMMPDMFEPNAGIRTLSSFSRNYQPNSYHNGSIWPHDNAIIAEGFEIHGFHKEAQAVKKAILNAIAQFETPIELFVYNGNFTDWVGLDGQRSCRKQAWSAASIMDISSSAT